MQILYWSTVSFAVLCTMLLSSMGGSAAANTLCVNPKACRDANWSRRGPPPRRATGIRVAQGRWVISKRLSRIG